MFALFSHKNRKSFIFNVNFAKVTMDNFTDDSVPDTIIVWPYFGKIA